MILRRYWQVSRSSETGNITNHLYPSLSEMIFSSSVMWASWIPGYCTSSWRAGESSLSLIRTFFFRLLLYEIPPCVSNQNQPHDVVEVTIWLKMWSECRKGEDGMTVNQELDLDGRAENGGNLSRAIPWTHLPVKKISRCRTLDTPGQHITTRST